MLKATGKFLGRETLFLGLSFANLKKFRDAPKDTFIKIDGQEFGLSHDVVLFSGKTEADCAEVLADGIGPDTKVNIDPKLQN